jgi:FlaG/FlaF family flagellin (archaellin)
MECLRLLRDDQAVSQVVAVVLVVAITVVISVVVGGFALGLGGETTTVPSATFDFDAMEKSGQPDELRITHASGDRIENNRLYITGSAGVQDEDGSPSDGARITWYDAAEDDGADFGDEVGAGDSVLVEPPDSDPELEDKTFTLVWEYDGESTTLTTWDGEDV